jgi:hypothetical protein
VYDKALIEQGQAEENPNPPEEAVKEKSSKEQSRGLDLTEQSPNAVKAKAQSSRGLEAAPQGRSPKEVKTAGYKVKMADAEESRKEDQKLIRERIDKHKQMREQRFERMTENIFSNEKLVMEVAGTLRAKESDDFRRKSGLYNDWSGDVYQPISDQLHDHLNPFNRSLRQSLRGTKSVDFKSTKGFQATCPLLKDPLKRNLRDFHEEEFFHRTARTVLHKDRHSHSMPDLQRTVPSLSNTWSHGSTNQVMRSSSSATNITARPSESSPFYQSKSTSSLFSPNQVQLRPGRSKPTLEPVLWGQMKLQDTMFGHFAQICEEGPGFKCLIRSGNNVFIPDETDGITAAGKVHTRLGGFNDVGILKGTECSRGESIRYKMPSGASNAAPTQDHYTYDTSTYATNLEFPPGKKVYPHMH